MSRCFKLSNASLHLSFQYFIQLSLLVRSVSVATTCKEFWRKRRKNCNRPIKLQISVMLAGFYHSLIRGTRLSPIFIPHFSLSNLRTPFRLSLMSIYHLQSAADFHKVMTRPNLDAGDALLLFS